MGFTKNTLDFCVYHKVNGRNFGFLILYLGDILLASNNLGLLLVVKRLLYAKFKMTDLGETTYVLGIEFQKNRLKHLLGLSQRALCR